MSSLFVLLGCFVVFTSAAAPSSSSAGSELPLAKELAGSLHAELPMGVAALLQGTEMLTCAEIVAALNHANFMCNNFGQQCGSVILLTNAYNFQNCGSGPGGGNGGGGGQGDDTIYCNNGFCPPGYRCAGGECIPL